MGVDVPSSTDGQVKVSAKIFYEPAVDKVQDSVKLDNGRDSFDMEVDTKKNQKQETRFDANHVFLSN